MTDEVLFSSERTDWRTPSALFQRLNKEFAFTLDPAADDQNHLCEEYYTEETDGLAHSWAYDTAFINPPYGRQVQRWIKKAHDEARLYNATCVLLVPIRSDTKWWHDYAFAADEIRLISGRVKFLNSYGMPEYSSPFPSALLVYYPGKRPKAFRPHIRPYVWKKVRS